VLRAMGEDEDKVTHVLVHGLRRFRIEGTRTVDDVVVAKVHYHEPDESAPDDELKAYAMSIVTTLKELVQLNPLQGEAIRMFLDRSTLDAPEALTDFAANLTTAEGPALQDVLDAWDLRERIERVLLLLKKEVELAKLQQKIQKQIEEKLDQQIRFQMETGRRHGYLEESLRSGPQEGGTDPEWAELEKAILETPLPGHARDRVHKEFDRLLTQAEGTLDVDARRKIMAKLEKIMYEDGPITQPFWKAVVTFYDKRVQGAGAHPTNYIFPEQLALGKG